MNPLRFFRNRSLGIDQRFEAPRLLPPLNPNGTDFTFPVPYGNLQAGRLYFVNDEWRLIQLHDVGLY